MLHTAVKAGNLFCTSYPSFPLMSIIPITRKLVRSQCNCLIDATHTTCLLCFMLLYARYSKSGLQQILDGTNGVAGDNYPHHLEYVHIIHVEVNSCMHLRSFCRTSFLKVWAACNPFLLACSPIYSHLQTLLSLIGILSFTMDSKDETTTHMDTSVPDYDLSLSNSDDAAMLGMIIITCQSPSLTFNHSETRLQAGVASKFFQARSFCNCVQYYGAFAFNCLNARLFHSCWASWHGLG